MLTLPREILGELQAIASAAYPEECCGILMGTAPGSDLMVKELVRAPNVADPALRTKRYIIDPITILNVSNRAHQLNLDIIGYYHSHPDHPAVPSQFDLHESWPNTLYLIVSIDGQGHMKPRAWFIVDGKPVEQTIVES